MIVDADEHVFEAFWVPRWYRQDQPLAVGQESVLSFRGQVPPHRSIAFLAAGLDSPRHDARCRVLGLRHPSRGSLQAIRIEEDGYQFVLQSGEALDVGMDGSGAGHVDWTVRVVLQLLPRAG